MADVRRESRERMIQRARITFGSACLDGVMLDLSPSGARVYLRRAEAVPEHVQLQLPDGAFIPALRRWRKGDQLGFAFMAPLPPGGGAPNTTEARPVALAPAGGRGPQTN